MKKDNSKVIWLTIAIIILAVVIIFAAKAHNASAPSNTSTSATDTGLLATEDLGSGSANAPVKSTAPVTITYAEALQKYKGKIIQINDKCQASPIKMTFTNNTNIMIDNRSAVGRTIKIGSTFTVKGYGFKIINLSSSTFPVTYLVDCDKSQNVATILLQK